MATQSFFEDMIIDTEEAAQRLLEAFDEADSGAPGIDTSNAIRVVTDLDEIGRLLD